MLYTRDRHENDTFRIMSPQQLTLRNLGTKELSQHYLNNIIIKLG